MKIKNIFKQNQDKVKQIEKQNILTKEFEAIYPVQEMYNQSGIVFETDFVIHSNKYSKSFYLTGLPKYLDPEKVAEVFKLNDTKLLKFQFDYTLKLAIENDKGTITKSKMEMAKTAIQVENQALKFFKKSDTLAQFETSEINSIEAKMADGQELNDVVFVLTIFANSETELKIVDNQIQSRLKNKKWHFNAPFADQKNTFANSLPIPTKGGHKIKLLSEALSLLIVPTNTRKTGLLPLGQDVYRNNVYFWDIFREGRAWTISVTGKNGTGKSATVKALFENLGLLKVQRFFIDPEGETLELADHIGAKVEMTNQSRGVNPVYYNEEVIKYYDEEDKKMYNPKKDQILFMTEFFLKFPVFPDELIKNRTPLYKAFNDFYDNVGSEKKNRNIDQLINFIQKNDKEYEIYNYMSNFGKDGIYYGYVSSTEDYDLESDAVIFVTKGIRNEGIRTAMGVALLMQVWEKMLRGGRYRALFIDELLMYLRDDSFRELLIQYISRARKYNAFFVIITQELNHFKKYDALSILQQTGFDLIFQQKNIEHGILSFTENQLNDIKNLPIRNTFIHVQERDYLDKVSIYLRPHQVEYSKKKGNKDFSINMMNRYPESDKTLSEILN